MKNIEYYKDKYDKIVEKAINLLKYQPSNREGMSKYMRRLTYLKGIMFALEDKRT